MSKLPNRFVEIAFKEQESIHLPRFNRMWFNNYLAWLYRNLRSQPLELPVLTGWHTPVVSMVKIWPPEPAGPDSPTYNNNVRKPPWAMQAGKVSSLRVCRAIVVSVSQASTGHTLSPLSAPSYYSYLLVPSQRFHYFSKQHTSSVPDFPIQRQSPSLFF